jgi:hypothetical protein
MLNFDGLSSDLDGSLVPSIHSMASRTSLMVVLMPRLLAREFAGVLLLRRALMGSFRVDEGEPRPCCCSVER